MNPGAAEVRFGVMGLRLLSASCLRLTQSALISGAAALLNGRFIYGGKKVRARFLSGAAAAEFVVFLMLFETVLSLWVVIQKSKGNQ